MTMLKDDKTNSKCLAVRTTFLATFKISLVEFSKVKELIMLRQDVDEEDLRTEIFSLRKHIARVCSENQILKVKIRKLQDEMMKRDKQLDEFLNSKRFFGFSKNLQDKGASVLMNLKVKNDKLEQSLLEKEMTIKRLQNTLQTAKLYNANHFNKKYASKGVECILLGDNTLEYQRKGSMNTKIELHMPSFDMSNFDYNEEHYDNRKDAIALNRKNSVESQFLLDINLDVKQTTKPSFYSETRYESRSASYRVEAKGSKSEALIERLSEEYIPIGPRNKKKEHKRELQNQSQRGVEGDYGVEPTFKKILRNIEEMMSKGTNTDLKISSTMTIDESVQFPFGDSELLGIVDTPSDDLDRESLVLTSFKSENQNFEMDKILENEQPPSILDEIQANDQSDQEACSVSEKIDGMEKSETRVEQPKNLIDREMPHEEIKQLHVYLLDMISQVDCLKDTISQMKADQNRTESDLKTKDESIDKLAKEIEELKEFRSFSSMDVGTLNNHLKPTVEVAEKDNVSVESIEVIQKATQQNIKKIAGKMKHLRDTTQSKTSITSQKEKKTSRSSSKNSKPEKRKTSEKPGCKKSDKKPQETPESKNVFGIGNGDVVDVPFYRCAFVPGSPVKTTKNEYDELD